MRGPTHAAIGFVTGAAVAAHYHIEAFAPVAGVLALATLFSLAPDIDHPASWASRRAGVLALPFRLLSHRGFTHSLVALLLLRVLLLASGLPGLLVVAILAGYASHIFADFLTVRGVKAWWPIPWRVGLPPALAVGGPVEYLIAAASVLVAIGLLV